MAPGLEGGPWEVQDDHCIGSCRSHSNYVDSQKAGTPPLEWCESRQGAFQALDLRGSNGDFWCKMPNPCLDLDRHEEPPLTHEEVDLADCRPQVSCQDTESQASQVRSSCFLPAAAQLDMGRHTVVVVNSVCLPFRLPRLRLSRHRR